MSVSVLILTLNEEANIGPCIASLSWCNDVVVLDSLSADRTVEIAEANGARVMRRPFDSFASQRNHALDSMEFKHPWLFHLDADERLTEPLRRECFKKVSQDQHSGYLVPSKMMFMGHWLKHAGMYPSHQMRLLKIGEVRFIQKGHGQREGEAKRGIGVMREPYLHYGFSKGLDDWFAKHIRYAGQEASDGLHELRNEHACLNGLLSSDPVRRRRALKLLSVRLPFRPTLRFLYMYFWRMGFLDGMPGLTYCRLMAMYERMIVLKMKEIRRRAKGLTL